MTIPASMPIRVVYLGDGVTVNFPIPFAYFANADGTKQLSVVVADATGENETVLTENTDFTITAAGQPNGTLTMNVPLGKDKKLTIVYNIPIEQTTDWEEFGRLPSESIETSFDKVVAILKQHQEILDRCVKVVISGNQTPQELLDEVYEKLDSATQIAADAREAANEATTAADNAAAAVEQAEGTLASVTEYVDSAKVDIEETIEQAILSAETTVSNAAKANLDEYFNDTVEPSMQDYVAAALSSERAAANSANMALSSKEAASASEINAAASENAALVAANAALQYRNEAEEIVNMPQATEILRGGAFIATAAEVAAGTNDEKIVTPSKAAGYFQSQEAAAEESERIIDIMQSKITNCLLEVPQDIKLELNNGTLTLKAGSKVYDGSGDIINITNDISAGYGIPISGLFMVVAIDEKQIFFIKPQYVTSGNVAPKTPINERQLWYDTTSKIVKMYSPNESAFTKTSLPIAIVTSSGADNKFASIDQVFNGFGFIGNCLFALPGVKLLMPNGRNSDGSLNNFEYTTLNPAVSEEVPGNRDYFLGFTSGGGFKRNQVFSGFYVSDSFISTSSQWCLLFNTTDNFYYSTGDYGATWNKYTLLAQIGTFTGNNGKISRLNVRQPFRAANDQESVHKNGNEEIFGRKTFSGSGVGIIKSGSAIDIQNPNVDLSITDGSASGTTEIHFIDKNDIIQGIVEHQNRTSGDSVMILAARNHANNSWTSIECGFDKNDNPFAKAPIPSLTNNSTNIATTSWVRQTDGALGLPNLTASVTLSKDTSYTTPQKGWLYFRGSCAVGSDLAVDVTISGVKYEKYIYLYQLGSVTNAVAQWVPIDKGATILAHGGGNLQEFLFYPSK